MPNNSRDKGDWIPQRKLNLGCGTDIRPGWINLDQVPLPGVNIVHDLNVVPYPFPDDHFAIIHAIDVLEHLDFCTVMKELWRVLEPGGRLIARIPHFTSKNNFVDPTHTKMFSVMTFEFFVRESFDGRTYYPLAHFSRISSQRITFQKRPLFMYNYIIERIVNTCHFAQYIYESTGLCRLFPAENIIVELIK